MDKKENIQLRFSELNDDQFYVLTKMSKKCFIDLLSRVGISKDMTKEKADQKRKEFKNLAILCTLIASAIDFVFEEEANDGEHIPD